MTEPAYDLVIRNGRVATASDVFEADVAIASGNQRDGVHIAACLYIM